MAKTAEGVQSEDKTLMFRMSVFNHLRLLANPNLCELTKIHGWQPFFTQLFRCQYDPCSLSITSENLGEYEKKIIQDHFPIFITNFMSSHYIDFGLAQRESLSGLTVFRVEALPLFSFVNQELIFLINRLCWWEGYCKANIAIACSKGIFEEIDEKCVRFITEDFKRRFPWWTNDYKGDTHSVDCRDEYTLDD